MQLGFWLFTNYLHTLGSSRFLWHWSSCTCSSRDVHHLGIGGVSGESMSSQCSGLHYLVVALSHLCGFAPPYHTMQPWSPWLSCFLQAFDVALCWKLDAAVLFSFSIRQRRHSRLATFLPVVCWHGQRRAVPHLNFGSANCVFGANASSTGCARSQHLRVLRFSSSWFGWHVFAPKLARLCMVTYCGLCFAVLWILCRFLVIGSLHLFGTFQSASCSCYFSYSSCRAYERNLALTLQ